MHKKTRVPLGVAQRYVGPPVAQTGPDSRFRVSGDGRVTDIPMTRDAMRRLFHLGYAFNLRQLKYLEFGASLMIGSVDVPDFQRNLLRIKELVNDHETHAICDKVLAAFPNPEAEYVVGVNVAHRN
jgi:hypothetical protein